MRTKHLSGTALRFVAISAVVLAAGAAAVGQGYRYEVIPLGQKYGIEPIDINEQGDMTGLFQSAPASAFVLDNSGLTILPSLPGTTANWGRRINAHEDVLGTAVSGVVNKSVLWVDGKPIDLGMLFGEGGGDYATDLNDSRQLSVRVDGMPGVWENGAVTFLDLPPSYFFGTATGINNSGNTSGTVINLAGNPEANRWVSGVFKSLHPMGYTTSQAHRIADNGDIGGQVSRPGLDNAALWRGGKEFIDLGNLAPGTPSYFNDLNSMGQVVGQSANSLGEFRGFLWDNGKMLSLTDLVEPGWRVYNAWAINDRGQILAGAYSPEGPGFPVLLNPVPEPSSGVVLFVFATSLFLRWRLKRCAVATMIWNAQISNWRD